MTDHFNDIVEAVINRRQFLKNSASVAVSLSATSLFPQDSYAADADHPKFNSIPHSLKKTHSISKGYTAQKLISWGDDLSGRRPDALPLTMKAQQDSFGYNNDYIAYCPLSSNGVSTQELSQTQNSEHGLLCINHEYVTSELMFAGYKSTRDATKRMTVEETKVEMMACGHSVIEIKKVNNKWNIVENSAYQRRITPYTEMDITGPASGNQRLKTKDDPSGKKVLGTIANCAGGKTPWGTVLISEENFSDNFSGNPKKIPREKTAYQNGQEVINNQLFETKKYGGHWARADPRFNIEIEPNEINRFGWVVEFNPYDPNSTPKKRTALGRFEHEGATIVHKPGKPIVAYSGDDDENQFVYQFVSDGVFQPGGSNNKELLNSGTLYCAKFNADSSGEWLPLLFGKEPLTPANGFNNQADVLIDTRRAAQLVGATPMDRPEDIETNPTNDRTYIVLTKNDRKTGPNSANPKFNNLSGHIIEITPPGKDGNRDHTSRRFQWQFFLIAGNPTDSQEKRGSYGNNKLMEPSDWLANPDNIAFDPKGRIWIATDGSEDFNFTDGLWCAAVNGEHRAIPKHFFSCPTGSELCGPEFTPDGKTLFVSVQHPGDTSGSTYSKPSTRWPDFKKDTPPRPTVMVITKDDEGIIGG